MSSWISRKGIWTPAPERAYVPPDPDKGREEGEIYTGPDRQAQAELRAKGVDHLGMPADQDPDVIMRARQLNMTVEEFMKLNEPPTPATVAAEKAKESFVQTHKPAPKSPGVQPQGGASPETGDSGGFGSAPGNPVPVSGQTSAPTQ